MPPPPSITVPLRHRWSIQRHFLAGILPAEWRRLRAAHEVDAAFRPRAWLLGALARFNAVAARRETRKFGAAIAATPLPAAPVFLLGHWRSGTTHLHHLLSLDARFAFVSTLHAIHPHTSLVTARLFGGGSARPRPMDNLQQGSGTPQEDEFALATRTLASPFLGYVFPRAAAHYDRYLTFDDATGSERAAWKAALRATVQKASWLAGGRPLVLKSPPHTARVALLREVFPAAKFVHLHRDPFTVFQSQLRLNDTQAWHSYLQVPDPAGLVDAALRRYQLMFEGLYRDVPAIPAGHWHELAFAELERDPLTAVEAIYRALDLPDFAALRPQLAAHLAAQPGYEKNRHTALEPELRARIAAVTAPTRARWGYA